MKDIISYPHKLSTTDKKKYTHQKTVSEKIHKKLKENGFEDYAGMVNSCGNWLEFSHQQNITDHSFRCKLIRARFCKFRLCPMCQWRKSLRTAQEILRACEQIEKQRKVKYLFLTLTMKNPPVSELKEAVEHLNKSFKRLVRTDQWKRSVLGHFKAIEILGAKTPAGQCHPHIHVLLIVPDYYYKQKNYYITKYQWEQLWQKAMGVDYFVQTKIQSVKPNPKKNLTALEAGVYETCKYSIKPNVIINRTDTDFQHIINQTNNMRFYAKGGILKAMKIPSEDLIDSEHDNLWIEIARILYTWNGTDYLYSKTTEL